jgi:sulfur carrier protein ThiS
MATAWFRFYAELNDLLPAAMRQKELAFSFKEKRRSVKDMIESLGIPHTEVDLILVNGVSATFERHIEDGDRISVYPVFEGLDISDVTLLRPRPLRETKLLVAGFEH